jgi:hypothetical protein
MDGLPLPVCRWARAKRCRTLRAVAAKGSGAAKAVYAWGLQGSLIISVSGVITGKTAPAAPLDEREALGDVLPGIQGLFVGAKGYISKPLHKELLMDHHVDGETPLRRHRLDTRPPDFVTSLVQIRRLVETVRG